MRCVFQIVSLLHEIGRSVASYEVSNLAGRSDIHLNQSNMLIRGRQMLFCNLHEAVKGVDRKMSLSKFMQIVAKFCRSSSPKNSATMTRRVLEMTSECLFVGVPYNTQTAENC